MAACVVTAGCGNAGVDALAVWIDGNFDEQGNRKLQLYERGGRREVPFEPTDPGTGTELLQMATDNRARGIAASGTLGTVYLDLQEVRLGRLAPSVDDTRELAPDFGFLRSGDALYRELLPRTPTMARRLGFMPLTGRFGLTPTVIDSPGEPGAGARWEFVSAIDAPVMFWLEVRGAPAAAGGVVQAVVYPSVDNPPLDVVAPTVVATGQLTGRGIDETNAPARSDDGICPNRICVSPSGRVLTTQANEACALWQWRWEDAVSPTTPLAATRIRLPDVCPAEIDPYLVATIGDDLVVMDGDERIFLFDLRARTMRAVPKVGDGIARVILVDRGTAILYVTFSGQVARIDDFGPRLVSTEQSFCSIVDGLTVSPSGNWVVMSCNDAPPVEGGPQGLVMRISALGLEQYSGINMNPLAVDDEGSALLYSSDPDDNDAAPRGLFVLDGDGVLARVDDLEPGPDPIALPSETAGRLEGRFFHATAIARQ